MFIYRLKIFILRILGYPGYLRIDHPTNLLVNSGIKKWKLNDITTKNKVLYKVGSYVGDLQLIKARIIIYNNFL